MRVLLDPAFKTELASRLQFLYETFGIYFLQKNDSTNGGEQDALVILSFPESYEDEICIIFGHNDFAARMLREQNHYISEKNVFIIACRGSYGWNMLAGKKIVYFPKYSEDIELTYKGDEYGFDFDVTDAELNLYNDTDHKDPYEKLLHAFKIDDSP